MRILACTLILATTAWHPLIAQDVCGMRERPGAPQPPLSKLVASHTGCHIPTTGTVRALVLFIQTRDDNMEDSAWPLGRLPVWANEYADALQAYFHDMSNGALNMILDVHPELMKTPESEGDYFWTLRNYGHATKDILKKLDTQISYGPYDMWNAENRAYSVISPGEGRVDLIITVYRRVEDRRFMSISGVSDLGFAGYIFVNSGKYIFGGSGQSNDAGASGISLCEGPGIGVVTSYQFAYRVSIHEIMHKLSGEGHPANMYGQLGVLAVNGGGISMNSYEKHALGYADFHELSPMIDTTIELRDFASGNEAYLLPIPQATEALYYFFEYRALKSKYDTAPGKGVYIFRLYDSWSRNQKEVLVMDANGNYDWALDSTTGKIFRLRANALGGTNVYQKVGINNQPYYPEKSSGDPTSAFVPGHGRFTVLHNPTPDFIWHRDTIRTGLFINVVAMTDSTATVEISYRPPAILESERTTGTPFALEPSYPNPVSRVQGQANIRLSLPSHERIALRLHDMLGRAVAPVFEGELDEGRHTVALPVHGLPTGTYALTLENGRSRLSRLIMITD